MTCPEWKTEDGFDMQFGTNHLGHFLLTELVAPLLYKSAASGFDTRYSLTLTASRTAVPDLFEKSFCFRIVIVSSMAHYQGRIYWRDIHFEKKNHKYNRVNAYTQSKLANVMHARELASRSEGTGITVCSLHPGKSWSRPVQHWKTGSKFDFAGVIDTDLHRHMYKTWWGWILWPFHKFFAKTPFFGAQTTLFCCLDDSVQSGGYYSDCRPRHPSRRSLDDRGCKKLWDMSEKMVGLRSSQSEML